VGRGDSGKTTILEAIEQVLYPNWNTPISDNDFYNCDTSTPLEIEVTLRGVADRLLSDTKYGTYIRALDSDGVTICNEITNDHQEKLLTILFKVENDLESELAQHCLMYWVYEGKSFVVRNPVEINLDDQNRPHSYNRPSMLFANGDCLCHFSGIEVPMKYVKAKTFSKEEILSEVNVDIRREMVAKIGILEAEKVLGAESVDKLKTSFGGNYELLMIDYKGNGDKKPYLKMKNPSIKAYHIEGVSDSVKNVKDAIKFRMNLNDMPDDFEIASVT
jgi:hypothetical protein